MEERVVSIEKNKKFVTPEVADIRANWDQVRPGIQNILDENPKLTYVPEDVYSECVNSRATLFMSPLGFLVLTTEVDPFTHEKTLVVWLAYVYEKGKHNWLTHIEWFEQLAKALDCRFIEAQSAVNEFEEYFINNGWELDTRIYIREVK